MKKSLLFLCLLSLITNFNNSPIFAQTLEQILAIPSDSTIEQKVNARKKIDFNPDIVTREDISKTLKRYDFPIYASNEALAEQSAYSQQSNIDAISKGFKNVFLIALGVAGQVVVNVGQFVSSSSEDENSQWGKEFIEDKTFPIYQPHTPYQHEWSTTKSIIAGGSEVLSNLIGHILGYLLLVVPIVGFALLIKRRLLN